MEGLTPVEFTERQAQVLRIISELEADGRSHWTLGDVGDRLGISAKAVKGQLLAVARKRELARGIDIPWRRPKIPPPLRRAVIERDGLVCRLCGDAIQSRQVDVDHLWPVAWGGRTTLSNLQVTHAVCNRRKGAKPPQRGLPSTRRPSA